MNLNNSTLFFSNKLHYLIFIIIVAFFIIKPSATQAEEWTYTTRPGDTIWDISKKYLKSVNYWERLQKHNNVDIAKRLAPGNRLRIPLEWLKNQAAPAIAVNITGSVKYKSTVNEEFLILKAKQTIDIGDMILTDTDGSALIQFADGSTLLVQSNSQVTFNTLSSHGSSGMVDTRFRLQQGRIETSVKPMRNSNSRYEITTPAAVAAVRGTQFRVAYTEEQQVMSSEVVKGSVNVSAEGVETLVKKGFGIVTKRGHPPQEPVKLLKKPELNKLPNKIKHLPYSFSWPALIDAEKYRIQVSPAKSPDILNFDVTTAEPAFTLSSLENGHYIFRVRGVDKINLEGFNAEHKFEINTSLPTVKLISPANNIDLNKEPYHFEWSFENNVTQYHLQVSTDNKFQKIIIDQIEDKNTVSLDENLKTGQYFWRVAAIDGQGNKGMFSDIEQFSVVEKSSDNLLLLLLVLPLLFLLL